MLAEQNPYSEGHTTHSRKHKVTILIIIVESYKRHTSLHNTGNTTIDYKHLLYTQCYIIRTLLSIVDGTVQESCDVIL